MVSILKEPRSHLNSKNIASPRTRHAPTPLTSPLSFRTAPTSPSSQISVKPIDFGIPKKQDEVSRYRDAKTLPYELRHHCLVYLEEQLYTSALRLLNNILSSGNSYPTPAHPAFAPPTSHLALTSTLLVHPSLTTRASSKERLEVSSEALILLRHVLSILGPVNADLGNAFAFSSAHSTGLRHSRRTNGIERKASKKTPDGDISEDIYSPLVENGIWARGQDFWHVVGWAFNCSVKHPKRWEYWRVWLTYMLDVIDADWQERSRLDTEAYTAKQKVNPNALPVQTSQRDGLLLSYLGGQGNSSSRVRRVVKSLFADGSIESIRAYPEVFEDETRERKIKAGDKRKRELKVDIEEDIYGDYIEEEDTELVDVPSDISSPNSSAPTIDGRNTEPVSKEDESALTMGGPDAVALRLRLLALLSRACHTFPDSFTSVVELYTMLFESISPLPLRAFSIFVSPSPYLPDMALSSLAQLHLARLLPASTPTSSTENDELSQEILENCFLPFAATTSSVEDNAKVSILIETLFRLFASACDMQSTARLATAVEKGIAAREARTIDRRKKAGGAKSREEVADRVWLNCSAQRIRFLLQFVQKKGKKAKRKG